MDSNSSEKLKVKCCVVVYVWCMLMRKTVFACAYVRERACSAGKLMSLPLLFPLYLMSCLISVFLYENMSNDVHMHTFISLKATEEVAWYSDGTGC